MVIHIVLCQLSGRRDFVVAVDAHRGKGQLCGAVRDEGAFQAAQHDAGRIHLTVRDREAQRGAIGTAAGGVGRERIVEQDGALLIIQCLTLLTLQLIAQTQLAGLVQLRLREGAAQVGHLIAQQLEHCRDSLFQRHGVVRAEGAVGVAAHPALLHRDADIGRIRRAAGQVLVQGAHGALRAYALPEGGIGHQHPGKGPAGDHGVQRRRLGGVHAVQRDGQLHGGVGIARRCGRERQHRHGHADREKECEKTFFHLGNLLNHTAGLRWG